MTLRVAFFGNIANNFYQIAKALRDNAGIEAHLFVDSRSQLFMFPESDDPELRHSYPDWIRREDFETASGYVLPWQGRLVSELRSYDATVVSATGPIFAQFSDRPWAFFVTGGDLMGTPFPFEHLARYRSIRSKAANVLAGLWQRRAIRRATQIWQHYPPDYSPNLSALERLGVPRSKLLRKYFPLVIDTAKWVRRETAAIDSAIRSVRERFDFVLFHPSRLLIRRDPALMNAADYRGNDLLIRAFAEVARSSRLRLGLVMPDWSGSPDVAIAKRIIADLEVDDRVIWLRPPRPEGFTRHELIPWYATADAVGVDFGFGWFGLVALEALAMGLPVLNYVDDGLMRSVYPWHPMLSSKRVDELASLLEELVDRPEHRRAIGARGRAWIEEFHSPQAGAEIWGNSIRALAGGSVRPS